MGRLASASLRRRFLCCGKGRSWPFAYLADTATWLGAHPSLRRTSCRLLGLGAWGDALFADERMTVWRPRTVRAIVAALALVATLLRLSAAVIMPLSAHWSTAPARVGDAYERFVAEFGPDAFLCAAMPGPADQHGQSRDGPSPGPMSDCAVCPLCTSIRDAATTTLLAPSPVLPTPIVLAALVAPIPDDDVRARPAYTPARARAPPTL